jgi:YidC/Oxa1 family membrane protein insertase
VIDFFVNIFHAIITPLEYLTSGILVVFHRLFGDFLQVPEGVSWALSIICLTIVIRTALIPLFVKQIKNSRNLQLLQPKVKELQKKYGHDRERLTQETMKLYKETGTNPLASCLPLLLQMPIFLALFRTLNSAADNNAVGFMTDKLATSLTSNAIFDHVFVSDSFTSDTASTTSKWVTAILVLAMTATTFTTQRQLMRKNMPESALTGQYAQQQKLLLYVLPVVFAVGGIAFPIGVLLYWTTSNLWTMGQQFYVIRNNPTPGTPAFEAKQKRDAAKHPKASAEESPSADGQPAAQKPPKPPPRAQPKKQSRSQRKRK